MEISGNDSIPETSAKSNVRSSTGNGEVAAISSRSKIIGGLEDRAIGRNIARYTYTTSSKYAKWMDVGYGAWPCTDLLQLGRRNVSGRVEYQVLSFSKSSRPSSADASKFAFRIWDARRVLYEGISYCDPRLITCGHDAIWGERDSLECFMNLLCDPSQIN